MSMSPPPLIHEVFPYPWRYGTLQMRQRMVVWAVWLSAVIPIVKIYLDCAEVSNGELAFVHAPTGIALLGKVSGLTAFYYAPVFITALRSPPSLFHMTIATVALAWLVQVWLVLVFISFFLSVGPTVLRRRDRDPAALGLRRRTVNPVPRRGNLESAPSSQPPNTPPPNNPDPIGRRAVGSPGAYVGPRQRRTSQDPATPEWQCWGQPSMYGSPEQPADRR